MQSSLTGYDPMAKGNRPDLETTLAQLESAIDKLENDQVTLQDSLSAFEQGIKLIRQAQQTLLDAEQKVQLLVEADGEPVSGDFSDADAK